MISKQLVQFLKNKGLSTKDIQIVAGMVRELEAQLIEKSKGYDAAITALRQQAGAVRSLTEELLERTRRRRELQAEIRTNQQQGLAPGRQTQGAGVTQSSVPVPPIQDLTKG